MKTRIEYWVIFIFGILLELSVGKQVIAQDASFSQFYANPAYLNPAMTAQNTTLRFGLNYRVHQINSAARFKTFLSTFEFQIPNSNSGLGLQFYSDEQGNGQLNDQRASLMYSYRFKISREWIISAGLQLTAAERSFDQSSLIFEDQLQDGQIIGSSAERLDELDHHDLNMSAGLTIQNDQFFSGLAIHHLNQPNEVDELNSFQFRTARKITAHAGYKIRGNSKYISIRPNVIYQQQAGHQQINLGNYVQIRNFTAGVWYSWNNALIALIGIQSRHFSFGYSVDMSTQGVNHGTAHEISLAYSISKRSTKSKLPKGTAACPDF